MSEQSQFRREQRYFVLKHTDIRSAYQQGLLSDVQIDQLVAISEAVTASRTNDGKTQLECVVVEHDWPEYQLVWQKIEERCQ